jgi:putative membrane protein
MRLPAFPTRFPLSFAGAALTLMFAQAGCEQEPTPAMAGNASAADGNGAIAGNTTAPSSAPVTRDYIENAAISDLYEIQSGRIAQTKARSDEIRSFADTMIKDHGATTAQLEQTIPNSGLSLTPPSRLDARHQALINQLQTATPEGFDELYRQQQILAHEDALKLHRIYARQGDNPALAQFAADAARIVQSHLDLLRDIDADRPE